MVNREAPEYILCAAIWFDNGVARVHLPRNIKSGIVVSGWRHHNCFTQLIALYPNRDYIGDGKSVQGFLTSKGHFLNRVDAAAMALEVGQISQPLRRLTSEDVW